MEGNCSNKKKAIYKKTGLIDFVFSWSVEDILNEDLHKTQVEKIPESFQSVHHYFGSFLFPLLEETRAELSSSLEVISRAPFAELIFAEEAKPRGTLLYNVNVGYWRNRFFNLGKEPYRTLPGDIFVVSDYKPETVSDLQLPGRTWALAWVRNIIENGNSSSEDGTKDGHFKLKISKDIGVGKQKTLYLIFLMNITTNYRIWNSLHLFGNVNVISEVLYTNSMVEEICNQCSVYSNAVYAEKLGSRLSSSLNESQRAAILCSLCKMQCNHKSSVELIWGPPGTGKTKTVSMLLWTILVLNYRVLTCAPTNVAITEVASRVLKLVKESSETNAVKGALSYSLGDLLLFGNKDRLKVDSDLEEIYLDYRVNKLVACFGPLTGWKNCFSSMINFFEDCVPQYHTFLENESCKDERSRKNNKREAKSFLGFARESFTSTALPLQRCIQTLATHIPKSFVLEHNFQMMAILVDLLGSFENLLSQVDLDSEVLMDLFSIPITVQVSPYDVAYTSNFLYLRSQCLSVLRTLQSSLDHLKLPSVVNKAVIEKFCFQSASLIFCTASSSHKLHSVKMVPVNLLVVDEAAQLKECELVIPLQLPGIRHAVLIGDEFQLPATVKSKVSDEVGFGRSLFERLSVLGHSKHLLDIQYRMHPSISCFPNSRFYHNKILNAPNVKSTNYLKHYLPGPMFGPYSFINVSSGKEELDDVGHSRKNMVEVAVVIKIVQKLYKAYRGSKMKLSIGVVSPYTAQVMAIQEKLARKYEKLDGFALKVKSIDGFQGGEEDIIIISTVRSNSSGSIGFISSPQRTNVALTRARHCLWILGNGTTLGNNMSIWEAVVNDARDRGCFHNADDDKVLAKAIIDAKEELVQVDDLLNGDSKLYKRSRWKVLFSDNFRKSFKNLKSSHIKKSVIILLLRLSIGWRPKKRNESCVYESSSQILKQFRVAGLDVVCTIDMEKDLKYFQVLRVWDILPVKEVPMLLTCLDSIFRIYTDDFLHYCKKKCQEGDLEVPMSWDASHEIVRCKNLSKFEFVRILSAPDIDEGSALKNSSVIESLLLMKFYSLTYQVVSHLLSDNIFEDLDLPYQVSDQELEIILCPSSIFIVGRPGGEKTTILTTKLLQRERQSYLSCGLTEVQTNFSDVSLKDNHCDGMEKVERTSLRQIFITVTPKLCVAVKQQLIHLKRSLSGGNFLAESSSIDMHDIDDTTQFVDIPDSFIDIPLKEYPLVVTFQKFVMMLDGSVGESYFKRFHMVGELFSCKSRQSRSIALYTFIKTKEVNCDRFISSYWPKFGIQLTKKLDAFTVFTEIISHIKGGLKALEACDGKLSREDYVIQSKGLVSALSRKRRERIYDIYLDYEKRKSQNDEFDMADLVIYLHNQLKDKRYEGAEMDFVYIDEVQRFTMSQIALLKYMCKNVDNGFVFSGDTAEIITRGFDFRFQDVQSMFYKKFVQESRTDEKDKGTKIRQISDILHLSQNCHSHVGLLRLAQSVMDLLFRFFPLSTDILCPEKCHSSLGNGESPILLEPRKGETVIKAIFGNSKNVGKNSVGFGAEQVILVRSDFARREIMDHIGNQALILTIMECQGLEFQDVLLYNFFSSSPFKKQWRVIYEYMKEQDMLGVTSPRSYPNLNKAKYIGLCWELKLLYVAVTRSRQRLWICEDIEDLSNPMFDYWKKLNIVQVRQLDDSLVHAMQVASSKEKWISQGIKLYCEGNYGMASICFERAGDTNREIWAKAAGLRTAANSMHGSNPEMACTALREAADIFNTLGKAESAAHCLIELKEYEKAAAIYLETYGESRLEDAGDCFFLAKCYKLAAEVYAKGNHFSKFLSVCTSAKFFDMGMQFIQQLKQHDISDDSMVKISLAVEDIKRIFLEQGARHYHDLQDNRTMMKFVRAFHSMDSRHAFLKALNCCDDLLLLEKESGNFTEDAAITNKKGDLLVEVDLLEKAGHFKDASMLILSYVIANSLWASGNKGWPLKQFKRKKKLLLKAKLLSKNDSDGFHECVCIEANILSGNESTLFEMLQNLTTSQRHESLTGVILSARIILDAHLGSKTSKYYWEDKMVTDLIKHLEEAISENHVSVKTLVYFWNFWKEKIMNLLQCLMVPTKQDCSDYMSYEEFSLNYLGVRKQFDNQNFIYLLLNPDAYWARTITEGSLQRSGNLVGMDGQQFVAAARSFWCSEVLSVGMKVLETLRALHMLSVKNSLSVLCRCITAIHIFEVTNFLTGSKCLESSIDNNTVQSLFDMGLQSIMYWRQNENPDLCVVYGSKETCDIVQIFLEKCALHYHDLQDNRTMMKFVRAFHSMDSKRLFLRNLDCLNELLLLEVELGNFTEAITIAKSKGNILLEADLLEKAGYHKDASMLLVCYVFTNSLWASGSKGWPLTPFKHKDKLLAKAKLYAKNDSDGFYEFVCTDANILSNQTSSLFEMSQIFSASERQKNLRGVILSARKILDAHLRVNISNYKWEDELATDPVNHSGQIISQNGMSVETLVYFWNIWKDNIVDIFEYLHCLEIEGADNYYASHGEFCLNYLGVQKQFSSQDSVYLLLNSDASWVKTIDEASLERSSGLHSMDTREFVSDARSYWVQELLSVGMRVLENVKAFYLFSVRNSLSVLCQSITAIHFFQVIKFITGPQFFESSTDETLQKFFNLRAQFIQYCKEDVTPDVCTINSSQEMDDIEHFFLKKCALHYHKLHDNKAMMMFVKYFHSMDSKRLFLRSLDCYDELLLLEEESGNFMEAITIARLKGDLLLEVDLLQKAGQFKEAASLVLFYVLANSLWAPDSKGWPLKQFMQKEELLLKAQSLAKNYSDIFYENVCTEADILLDGESSLSQKKQNLSTSQRNNSLIGEILSARKILDAHLQTNILNYEWEDELVTDLSKHAQSKLSQNQVSIETLHYFWNFWKEKIVVIIEYLERLETQNINEYMDYEKFCLNYLGVRKHHLDQNIYQLLNSEAAWVGNTAVGSLQKDGTLISMNAQQFAVAAQSYWCSELLSLGMRVLKILSTLYTCSVRNSVSLFRQSMASLHIFDVTKFLMGSKVLKSPTDIERLQKYIESSSEHFLEVVFSIDWTKSMKENIIALRGTGVSREIVKEVISRIIDSKNGLTNGKIGRVVMLVFGSGKLPVGLYELIGKKFDLNPSWQAFINELKGHAIASELSEGSVASKNENPGQCSLIFWLHEALSTTFRASWREELNYISPDCFLYIVERHLILVSHFQGCFYTSKSSFIEWLICEEWTTTSPSTSSARDIKKSLGHFHDFMASIVYMLLINKSDTVEWVGRSCVNVVESYQLLVWRLVVLMCLLCVNSGKYFEMLYNLPAITDISSQLPVALYDILLNRTRKRNFVPILAKALSQIENHLVIVNPGDHYKKSLCEDVIVISMKDVQHRDDILTVLFPQNLEDGQAHSGVIGFKTDSNQLSSSDCDQGKSAKIQSSLNYDRALGQDWRIPDDDGTGDSIQSCEHLWETFDSPKSPEEGYNRNVKLDKYTHFINSSMTQPSNNSSCNSKEENIFVEVNTMLDELKKLSPALDMSDPEMKDTIATMRELLKKLQMKKMEEPHSNNPMVQNHTNAAYEGCQTSIASGSQKKTRRKTKNIKIEESSGSKEGNMKAAPCKPKMGWETSMQMRKLDKEPLSNNVIVQNHTNAADEACQASIASGSQKKRSRKKKNIKTEESRSKHKGCALQAEDGMGTKSNYNSLLMSCCCGECFVGNLYRPL